MAEANVSVAQDQFICSICLDLLKDPVTIPCGHSYCMSCITDCWDQDDQKRIYSCPQCRRTFTPRPVLGKNTMLNEVVENVRKRKVSHPARCYAEPGTCDVCTGGKLKAVKSCLVCLQSYCHNHFEQHEEFHESKRHKMTDDTGRLQEMICFQHDKLLEMYCRTENSCICMACVVYDHKTHDTVSLVMARTEKQVYLEETQKQYQERIQEKENEIQELKETVETHKRSAQTAVEDSERIFTELIRSIKRSRSAVTQLIRARENLVINQADGVLKRLEQELDDLRRRGTELEQFLQTDDHLYFLQRFQSLHVPPKSDSPRKSASFLLSFDDVGKSMSHLREKLERVLKEEQDRIFGRAKYIEIIPTPEYDSREEFLQYFRQFTLDSDTVHNDLCLSDCNTLVTHSKTSKTYYDKPKRFDHCFQVLCRERVSGRCYWEVELSGNVCIAVSYESINRKGRGIRVKFGYNYHSWSLDISCYSYTFYYDGKFTSLPVVSRSSRIGVYVDHSAGTLSFYSISDTMMTLIHRVQTTFTQPLYPGFWVYHNAKAKLCDLKI